MQQIEIIQNNVDRLLADRGLGMEGREPLVSQMLHHLYVAMDIYRYMTQEEKNKAGYWFRMFKNSYTLKNFLKERKRKRDKEKSPLHPSYKELEKEFKEKGQKKRERIGGGALDLDDDQMDFWDECKEYIDKPYSEQMVKNFFYYWAEKSKKNGKMLWQTKNSWNLRMRHAAWSKRSYNVIDEAAAIRLEKTKAKQGKEEQTSGQQQAIAAEREQANQEREAEIERSKAGAVSYEEWQRLRGKNRW